MAGLKYVDDHNKVAFLLKPKESDDYHQIVDFLRGSKLRYALTQNPIIYNSLVRQFWGTAALRTIENMPPAIVATIDGTEYSIIEASIRSNLQLDDVGGLNNLPDEDIYAGLRLIGYPTEGKLTFYKNKFSPQWRWKSVQTQDTQRYLALALSKKLFSNMKMKFVGAHMPLLAAMLPRVEEGAGEEPAGQAGSQPTPSPIPIPSSHTDPQPPIIEPSTNSPPRADTIIPPFDHDQPSSLRLNETDEEPLTSTFMADESASGSFHETPPRSYEATPSTGQPLGKTESLESELKNTKKTLGTAVKQEFDMDSLNALADASLADQQSPFVTPSKDKPSGETLGKDFSPSTLEAAQILSQSKMQAKRVAKSLSSAYEEVTAGSEPNTTGIEDILADISVTPGRTSVPTGSAPVPTEEFVTLGNSTIPTGSAQVPTGEFVTPGSSSIHVGSVQVPSVSVYADKGKAKMVDEPTPTQERTFKQLEDYRLGFEAAERLQAQEQAEMARQREELLRQDELLARQLTQDFDMPARQKKRRQEVQEATMYYTEADWVTIMAKIQKNVELSRTLIGSDLSEADFASTMVEMISQKRRQLAEQKAKARRDRPMTQAEQRDFMRTFVKNQSSVVYNTGWTMKFMKSLPEGRLKEEFERIQNHLSYITQWDFTRRTKRSAAKMDQGSSKRLKPDEIEAASAPKAKPVEQVPIPSKDVRTSKDSELAQEKVESSKRTHTKWKSDPRKGLHVSQSTILIEEGDPNVEHKMCLKYASDEEDDYDSDNLASLYAVVDWEVLPTGLGEINVIYRKDNSHKYFTSLREILRLVSHQDLMTLYGLVVNYYQDKKAEGVGLLLWGDLGILMESPEKNDGSEFWQRQHTWNIQSWKLYAFPGIHILETLEIGRGAVGNELTTAVQLVKFLKQQIAASKAPGVHYCSVVVPSDVAVSKTNDYFNPQGAQDKDLSLKLEHKQVTFKFRGGLLGIIAFIVTPGSYSHYY
ncbi:hypothetical protein Tco_0579057 [Tanacetum coccineum]